MLHWHSSIPDPAEGDHPSSDAGFQRVRDGRNPIWFLPGTRGVCSVETRGSVRISPPSAVHPNFWALLTPRRSPPRTGPGCFRGALGLSEIPELPIRTGKDPHAARPRQGNTWRFPEPRTRRLPLPGLLPAVPVGRPCGDFPAGRHREEPAAEPSACPAAEGRTGPGPFRPLHRLSSPLCSLPGRGHPERRGSLLPGGPGLGVVRAEPHRTEPSRGHPTGTAASPATPASGDFVMRC